MGACLGRCCPAMCRLRRTLFSHSTAYDQANLMEFDMISSPNFEEPISEQSGQNVPTNVVNQQHVREDEDETFVVDRRHEGQRAARIVDSGQILINPARLVFRESVSSWGANTADDDNECDMTNGNRPDDDDDDDEDCLIDENKMRTLTSRTYLPNHSMFMDTGSSTVSSVNGRDWVHTNGGGSTPPSSLELEWDEAGVFLPSESNKNSTPASNDLEWDNDDFDRNSTTSANINNVTMDTETEQLISEIERLTSNALDETNHGYRVCVARWATLA